MPIAGRGKEPEVRPFFMPAPILGLNTHDDEVVMDVRYALELDNLFPEEDGCRLRRGYTEQCVSSANGKTLYAYHVGATKKLLMMTAAKIIDVSTSTASDLVGGMTNGNWSTVTMGSYGLFANGADTPRKYDGSTLSTNVWTGIANPATIVGLHVFAERIFAWEANARSFWYGGVQEFVGALTEFPLQYTGSIQGTIVGMGTWTFDGGEGVDDGLCIFFTSGQVIIYRGINPGDATDWSRVGIFQLPAAPLNARCIQKFGGDLLIATADGIFPLSKALPLAGVNQAITVSNLVDHGIKAIARTASSSAAWQMVLYPKGGWLLLNAPAPTDSTLQGTYVQYVMNTRTGAWCRFTGMDATAWAVHDSNLYFCGQSDATVYKADAEQATSDDGEAISGFAQQAFSNMGLPGRRKSWNLARPTVSCEGTLPIRIGLAVDYGRVPSFQAVASTQITGSPWDTSAWDVSPWGMQATTQQQVQGISGTGRSASFAMRILTSTQTVTWHSTELFYETGEFL